MTDQQLSCVFKSLPYFDFSLLGNDFVAGIEMNETADSTSPTLKSATLDLSRGTLTLVANETLNTTTIDMVDLSKIYIANSTGSYNDGIDAVSMQGAISVKIIDYRTIQIELTESQRVASMYLGNTTIAGDGTPTVLNIQTGALHDIAGNPMRADIASGLPIRELSDIIGPNISNPILYFGNATLLIAASETLDLTPVSLVNLDKFSFRLYDMDLSLSGASVLDKDRESITITLTTVQVTTILRKSNIFGSWDATLIYLSIAVTRIMLRLYLTYFRVVYKMLVKIRIDHYSIHRLRNIQMMSRHRF